MKMFCFPHAGGFAGYYSFMKKHSYRNIDEVFCYEYTGRGLRYAEKEAEDFAECVQLAAEFVEEHTDVDEKFVLFGHSMGAFVAYETAEILRKKGRTAQLVYISGQKPPCDVYSEYYETDMNKVYPFLKKLGGIPEFVEQNQEFRDYFFSLTVKDMKLLSTYKPTMPSGSKLPRCMIMYGSEDAELYGHDIKMWNKNFDEILGMFAFEGNHFYIIEHQDEAAELIDTQLDILNAEVLEKI